MIQSKGRYVNIERILHLITFFYYSNYLVIQTQFKYQFLYNNKVIKKKNYFYLFILFLESY